MGGCAHTKYVDIHSDSHAVVVGMVAAIVIAVKRRAILVWTGWYAVGSVAIIVCML